MKHELMPYGYKKRITLSLEEVASYHSLLSIIDDVVSNYSGIDVPSQEAVELVKEQLADVTELAEFATLAGKFNAVLAEPIEKRVVLVNDEIGHFHELLKFCYCLLSIDDVERPTDNAVTLLNELVAQSNADVQTVAQSAAQ